MTRTETLSLSGKMESIRSDIAEVREEAQREVSEGGEGESIKARFNSLRQRLSAFERFAEDVEGDEFVVKEMTFGELMRARDEVSQASYSMNQQSGQVEGVPRDGYYRIKVLEFGVKDAPQGAPPPKDYPYHVGDWVYNAIDELNTGGEADTGNLSLEEIAEG